MLPDDRVPAQLAESERAQKRIRYRVTQGIGVRVPIQTALGRHLDTPEHERGPTANG